MSAAGNKQINIILIILFALVANIPMAWINEPIWDDWAYYHHDPESTHYQYTASGVNLFRLVSSLHVLLNALPYTIALYKISTIVFCALSGILFYRILRKQELNEQSSFFASIFFVVLPLNSAKATMICYHYTLCLLLFLAAIYFLLICFGGHRGQFISKAKAGYIKRYRSCCNLLAAGFVFRH